jgi:branched-chain amino acid transport system substrate-binding protein
MRLRPKLALLAAVIPLAAACASHSGAGSSTSSKAGSPLTVFTMDPPPSPTFGDISVGPRAAAAAINKQGGVDGHPINVVVCNPGAPFGTPDQTATCLTQMESNQNVLALIGAFTLYTSDFYEALAPRNIPNLGSLPSVNVDFTNGLSYPLQPSNDEVYAGLSLMAVNQGCTKAAFVGSSQAGTIGTASAAWAKGAKYKGLALASTLDVPTSQVDFAPTIASLKGEGVNCIGFGLEGSQLQPLMTAIKSSGGGIKVMANVTAAPQATLNALGPLADGLFLDDILKPPGTTPAATSRLEASVKLVAPNGVPGYSIIEPSWGGVQLFAQAAAIAFKTHSTLTPGDINAAIQTITNFDYGFTEPIDFSKPGSIKGSPALRLTTVYEEKIVDTKITAIGTIDVAKALS